MKHGVGSRIFKYESIRFFGTSHNSFVLAFLWGFCEATFFFIIPDVYFGFIALFIPFFGILHGIISILGSMLGGIIMYKLTLTHPLVMTNFLDQIPGIGEKMILEVYLALKSTGIKALFLAPFGGTPYKIFAVQAAILQVNFLYFILMTFPSRLLRILFVGGVASAIGKIFQKHIQKHTRAWAIFYIVLWAFLYLAYAYFITRKY